MTLLRHAKKFWKRIIIVLVLTSCLGGALGLFISQNGTRGYVEEDEILNETTQEEILMSKQEIENNIKLFQTLIDSIESYLQESILITYNPMSLPTHLIKTSLQAEEDDKALLGANYVSAYRENDFYQGFNDILRASYDSQYIDELAEVKFDTGVRKLIFSVVFDDDLIGEKLVDYLYEYTVQSIEEKDLPIHEIEYLSSYSLKTIGSQLLPKVNSLTREKSNYQEVLDKEIIKLDNLIQTSSDFVSQTPSKGAQPIIMVRFAVLGLFMGILGVFVVLLLYSFSDSSNVFAAELKEVYGLNLIMNLTENETEHTAYPKLNLGEAKGYLDSLLKVRKDGNIVFLGNVETNRTEPLLKENTKDYFLFSPSSYAKHFERLSSAEGVVLLEELDQLTHEKLKDQLEFVASANKEVYSVLLM